MIRAEYAHKNVNIAKLWLLLQFMSFQISTEVAYDSVYIHGVESYGSYLWSITV